MINVMPNAVLTVNAAIPNTNLNLTGFQLNNGGTVNVQAGNTVTVNGSAITNGQNANFTLAGNIQLATGGTAGTFTNNGSFYKQNNANSMVAGVTFTQAAGTLEIDAGTLEFGSALTQTGGVTYLAGGNLKVDGTVGYNIQAGTLKGGGNITAALVENAGSINQTLLGGYQVLTITGTYKQDATGSLMQKIGKNQQMLQFDKLVVSGQATLGGNLTEQAVGGYVPAVGDSADVLDYGSEVGDLGQPETLPPGMTGSPQATQYIIKR